MRMPAGLEILPPGPHKCPSMKPGWEPPAENAPEGPLVSPAHNKRPLWLCFRLLPADSPSITLTPTVVKLY